MARQPKPVPLSPLKNPIDAGGYDAKFLGSAFNTPLPALNDHQKNDLVKVKGGKSKIDYKYYSVVMCKTRRLAYFTAVNIDGTTWKDVGREGAFKNDPRLNANEDQVGKKLYGAMAGDFDQGHLVRREDPQWGKTDLIARKAGQNTFWFTNCTPQHKDLNRKIWAELEANILHTGVDEQNLRINLFTGPVLAKTDGVFIKSVDGKDFQIPNLFWKVVVWTKKNKKSYAVGFLQSQEKFLIAGGVIKKQFVANVRSLKKTTDDDIFEHLQFKDGKTYQVQIKQIEKLTGLSFDWKNVIRPFKSAEPKALRGTSIAKPRAKAKSLARARGFEPNKLGNMLMTVKVSGLTL